MVLQLILSILGLVLAGGVVLVFAVRLLIRLASKRSPGWPVTIAVLAVAFVVAAVSTFGLVRATVELARQGKDSLVDAGKVVSGKAQALLSDVVDFGTVGVLEGFGQSADRFQAKWQAESLADARAIQLRVQSATLDGRRLTLVLSLTNPTERPIDFRRMVEHQQLLLTDEQGLCYPLQADAIQNGILPAGRTSVRQLDVLLPEGFAAASLRTPAAVVPLRPDRPTTGAWID